MARRVILIGLICCIGLVAAFVMPFGVWGSVSQELSIFFGLLGAALPQAMALTMQAQPPRALTISEAQTYSENLQKQQVYWFGLFLLSGVGILLLLGGKILSQDGMLGEDISVPLVWFRDFSFWPDSIASLNLAPLISGLIAAQITLLAANIVGMGKVILRLQADRGRALHREAQDAVIARNREEEKATVTYKEPAGFGDVIQAPSKLRSKRGRR